MNTEEKCLKNMSNPNYDNVNVNQNSTVMLSGYDSTLTFIVLFLIIVGFLAIFSAGIPLSLF